MAEIHPHPSEALSDADQQVTADFFKQNVWDRLIQRGPDITARGDLDAIISLRAKIDNIDQSLMKLVAERYHQKRVCNIYFTSKPLGGNFN